MPYLKRHMEDLVLALSDSWPAILLTGPRQAGKTTMLRHLAELENKNRNYVSLDDLTVRELAKTDPKMFLQRYRPPVLIDEVQYAPELFTYIKIHIDEKQRSGDFWLTGSQIFRLMRGVQESLAGRVAILNMSPLSQREITGNAQQPFSLDFETLLKQSDTISPVSVPAMYERLWFGCMPGLVSNRRVNRDTYYSSYITTYVERDVRDLSGDIDALKFLRFLRSVAARVSQLVSYKSMADDAEIPLSIAKSWLDVLETQGIVFLLHPYSNNVLKRTIKTPKLYFYDTGLVCYLARWASAEVAETGVMNGALLENFAVSEIVKNYQNAGLEPFVYYYRDRDDKEIDLLLERDGTLFPIEIKKTTIPDRRITKGFGVIGKSPFKRGTGAVLCLADTLAAFDADNLIVPIWLI